MDLGVLAAGNWLELGVRIGMCVDFHAAMAG